MSNKCDLKKEAEQNNTLKKEPANKRVFLNLLSLDVFPSNDADCIIALCKADMIIATSACLAIEQQERLQPLPLCE